MVTTIMPTVWKSGAKRKFYDPGGRGWITIYVVGSKKHNRNNPNWERWLMTVYKANGASYWSVAAKTRRELPGLMRLGIAMRKNKKMAVVHNKLTGGGKPGKQTKQMDNPFTLVAATYDGKNRLP